MQPDAASAPAARTRPTRILLVDDHEISRAALRALLRTEGLHVADVPPGAAAITAAVAFRPDVHGVVRAGPFVLAPLFPLGAAPLTKERKYRDGFAPGSDCHPDPRKERLRS